MKAAKPATQKHAGSAKHHVSHKHHRATGKHKPTAKQLAARKLFQHAGAHASHLKALAKKAKSKPVTWSPHTQVACCGAEAVAMSLRLAGHPVTERDMLDLYWLTAQDADTGAGLWDTVEAAGLYGLAGVRPLDIRRATHADTGVILELELTERHAVTVDGDGVWSWGLWRPAPPRLLAAADQAWVITWP